MTPMLRALKFLIIVLILSLLAAWLAEDPGTVVLRWRGARIDTSASLLLAAVTATAILTALIYRVWLFVSRSPANIGKLWSGRRRRKGYLALTRGMVAVAAGDAEEAASQSKKAEALLEDPPLTMLLSAQAAQLAGDEKAAAKFFNAMREDAETEFLGLRGLFAQAMKQRNFDKALELVKRAYLLRPKSGWVAINLFDLQARAGRWSDAAATLKEAVANSLTPAANSRRLAVLEYQMSIEAAAKGDAAKAIKHVRKANDLARDFIPASIRLARLYLDAGKARKAVGVIECAWRLVPHPGLLEGYWRAKGADDAIAKVKAAQVLAKNNTCHLESRLAVASAALKARLFGEARKQLTAISSGDAPARICRMMAELEELENDDQAASRAWLMRASAGEPDPAWVCDQCGEAVDEWSAFCAKCESFDAMTWRAPPHIISLAGQGGGAALPAAKE